MKKYFIIGCLLLTNTFYSQIDAYNSNPIKSPEATAFVNSSFLPLDEFTGKADITIALYSINLDGLEIPISISYDTGGVKVNTTSSNVGLNWSLSSGGLISREILGLSDINSSFSMNSEYSNTGGAYVAYGYLKHLLTYSPMAYYPIANAGFDNQPDQYHVIAPGLSTSFTHKHDGTPIEISNNNNIIKSPFTDPDFLFEPFPRINLNSSYMYSKINFKTDNGFKFGFNITNSNGFEYSFNEVEKGITFKKNRLKSETPSKITAEPYDLNTSLSIDSQINNYGRIPDLGSVSIDPFPTIRLSKIKNPITKREVQFIYEENKIVDNNQYVNNYLACSFETSSKYDRIDLFEHDITVEKILKNIIFPEGKINFYYDSNRLDVRGGKILKKIEIRNNEGHLIKGISFEQSYYSSQSDCIDSFYCSRLRLDGISFFDKDENKLNGYSFGYNNNSLPKRYSVDQDYLGYYNGLSNIAVENYKPKIYFKQNQGKYSFLPFPLAGYDLICNGNGSKLPNITYATAASLNKITLPTGGTILFDYELNSFDFLGSEITSTGLRIKQQSLFDNNNVLQKKLEYNYTKDNGLSSGQISNLPNYVTASTYSESADEIFQNYNNKLELNTKSSYVGYSKVKITEVNNGYTLKKYTNINEFPNDYPTQDYISDISGTDYNFYLFKKNNGLLPTLYKNNSVKRGNLISSEIFNNNNEIIKSVINEYKYTKYDEIPISENYTIKNRNSYTLNSEQYARFITSIDIQSNLLSKTITNEFSSTGQIINTSIYNYYNNKPILNESIITNSLGKNIKTKYYYPFDSEVSSLAYIQNLNNLNILKPIKEINYIDSSLISSSLNSYQNLGNNRVVLQDLQSSKEANPLELKELYSVYDKKANLIEYKRKDGAIITTLYGYDYENKIGDIIGATYQQVLTALNINNLESFQNKTDSELIIIFNNLRGLLPYTEITSYTHKPLVGITSITDAKGQTNYFAYDTFNRLSNTKDYNQNIIKEQQYHYSKTTSTQPIFQAPLSLTIEKKVFQNYSATTTPFSNFLLDAVAIGGRGNYNYIWKDISGTSILSTSPKYNVVIPCESTLGLILTVTDSNNTSIVQNVTLFANSRCNEPFYASTIQGSSGKYWVETEAPEGTIYKYTWWRTTGTITTQGGSSTITNYCPVIFNTTTTEYAGTLYVEIKDLESGYTVQRSRVLTITKPPEFQPPSCFAAGTKITMSNGKPKNIENVKVGDSILTYNIENKTIEIGNVQKIVTPIHSEFVELSFDNSITNTNTLDHPYYVKNKGWCSYDPELTLSNYGLHVKKYNEGDVVLHYDDIKKTTHEIRIRKLKLISKKQKTYNLQKVSKNHDFFANGILVHNKSIQ